MDQSFPSVPIINVILSACLVQDNNLSDIHNSNILFLSVAKTIENLELFAIY